jgi:ABC-type transport system involved in multi-copper enzyme maturation permease subunit
MDVQQTLRSWVFRVWALTSVLLSLGYLLHRTAIHHQAGILQSAASLMSELLQFTLLVGTTLVIVLTAGAISSERGTMADSVLSRGISRYQYFLGKWHARLVTILGTFLFVGAIALIGSCVLLQSDLSLGGSLMALLLVAAVLAVVVSAGVTVSALCQSTVLGIAVLWMLLHGLGVALAVLQVGQLNPARLFRILPALLRGQYDLEMQAILVGWCLLASVGAALIGLLHFSRCDV